LQKKPPGGSPDDERDVTEDFVLAYQPATLDRRLIELEARIRVSVGFPSVQGDRAPYSLAIDSRIDHVRRTERRSPRRECETLEDPARDVGLLDRRDQPHPPAAIRTDLEDALQQIRPRDATSERFFLCSSSLRGSAIHERLVLPAPAAARDATSASSSEPGSTRPPSLRHASPASVPVAIRERIEAAPSSAISGSFWASGSSSAFAAEGDEAIVAAGVAVDANEPMGKHAELEIRPDLAFDAAGAPYDLARAWNGRNSARMTSWKRVFSGSSRA
jgi:hypothetical protein